jgi:hypothetical protein
MKRKAFKTSPSIRVPRAAVEKLQESKVQAQAQAQAQAQDIIRLEKALTASGNAMDKAIHVYAMRHKLHFEALRDAVKIIDVMTQRAGKRPLPLLDVAEIKRLEEIRLLSIGV